MVIWRSTAEMCHWIRTIPTWSSPKIDSPLTTWNLQRGLDQLVRSFSSFAQKLMKMLKMRSVACSLNLIKMPHWIRYEITFRKICVEEACLKMRKRFFLISNKYPAEYQFGELTQAIVAILPQRQRESFILTIDNAQTYISQLGIPPEGSNRFSLLSFNTQTEVKALSTALGSTVQIGRLLATYVTESVVEECFRYFPFIGTIIASPLSYSATYYLLSKWLRKMDKIALKALEEILQNARSH